MRRLTATATLFVFVASTASTSLTAAHADTSTATTIYVSGASSQCSDSGTGTAAAPFCTLQAGVNAAVPGDTVLVLPGVYNIRYANGSWQGWHTISQPGVKVIDASIAGMPNGSSQLVEVTSTGVLKHDVRNANGSWESSVLEHNIRQANGSWQSTGWGTPTQTDLAAAVTCSGIAGLADGDSQIVEISAN